MRIDWSVFWSAFGALVSFAALLGGSVAGARAFVRRRTWDHLQKVLDQERAVYEAFARRISPPLDQSQSSQYIDTVRHGLLGIAKLGRLEKMEVRKRLSELVSQLRATHGTLVTALEPFMDNNAKRFVETFDKVNSDFGNRFAGDKIASEARTHCHDVARMAYEIATDLRGEDSDGVDNETLNRLHTLGYEIDNADNDIIVPTMLDILGRTDVELSLIGAALKKGDYQKAIWLKERFRFEILQRYRDMRAGLDQMDELIRQY